MAADVVVDDLHARSKRRSVPQKTASDVCRTARYVTVFNTEMQRIDGNCQCPLQAHGSTAARIADGANSRYVDLMPLGLRS